MKPYLSSACISTHEETCNTTALEPLQMFANRIPHRKRELHAQNKRSRVCPISLLTWTGGFAALVVSTTTSARLSRTCQIIDCTFSFLDSTHHHHPRRCSGLSAKLSNSVYNSTQTGSGINYREGTASGR